MNKFLLFFLVVLILEVSSATILKYTVGYDKPNCDKSPPWYLGKRKEICKEQVGQVRKSRHF